MKNQEVLNGEEVDHQLPVVLEAFASIYNSNSKQVSYSDTYNCIYKLCKRGMAEDLLNRLITVSINKFGETLEQMVGKDLQIEVYCKMISDTKDSIERISQILLYLESNYMSEIKKQNSTIVDILNSTFFGQLCKNSQILLRIAELVVSSKINNNWESVSKIIQNINVLDEKQVFFVEYLSKSLENLQSDHLKKQFVQKYENSEIKLFLAFSRQSLSSLREWLLKYYGKGKCKKIIEELMKSIYDKSFGELKARIYKEKSHEIFKAAIVDFLEMLNEKGDPKQINDYNDWFISEVKNRLMKINKKDNVKFLQQYVKEYQIINESVNGIKKFNIPYRATFFFENWINDDKLHFPKRLNAYFEHIISNNEVNQEVKESFSILFRFLKEKDYFQKQFRRHCALRMIYNENQSKIEDLIIQQMSNQCGQDWVKKLKALQQSRIEAQRLKKDLNPNLKVLVFDETVWCFEKSKNISKIPQQLQCLTENYKKSYEQAFKGRILQWNIYQGFCIVKINFKNCSQEFKMDTLMAILLLNLQNLKFKSKIIQMLSLSNLRFQQAHEQLELLIKQKIILVNSPLSQNGSEKFDICLNLDYMPEQKNLNSLIDFTYRYLQEDFAEHHGHEQLKAERKMMVEAFVVKIMKSNKQISMSQLYDQITPMIEGRGFKFNKDFVDSSFAGLVDKRYIKDLENGKYLYLAS